MRALSLLPPPSFYPLLALALLEENFRPRAACANVNLYSFPLDFFFFALALPPPPPPPEKNY
jgi:hypothetical protein